MAMPGALSKRETLAVMAAKNGVENRPITKQKIMSGSAVRISRQFRSLKPCSS